MTLPRNRPSLTFAVACAVALACGAPESEPDLPADATVTAEAVLVRERVTIYPLVAFRSEHPSRVEVTGDPRAEMVTLPSGRERAIVGSGSHSIRLTLPGLAGATVRGRQALLPARVGVARESATFRIAVIDAPSSTGESKAARDVATSRLDTGRSEAFEVILPDDLQEGAQIELSVTFPDTLPDTDAKGRGSAAWIDPVIRSTTKTSPRQHPAGARPNVLVITSDTTRLDDLGVYGGPVRTPALEKLAAAGVVFENAHSVAFGTTPSHASLMTSLPAAFHRVYDNRTILEADHPTLAEQLAANGYRAAAFVGAAPLARALGLAQGFDLYDDCLPFDPQSRLGSFTRHERPAPLSIERFEEWVDERSELPFFGWIHLFDAHQPYAPPEGFAEPYLPREAEGETALRVEAHLVAQGREPRYIDAPRLLADSPEQLESIDAVARGQYRGELAHIDEELGKLWLFLDKRDLFDRTIIVFVSDHGEYFADRVAHQAFDHSGLHREVTHLPLVIKPVNAPAVAGTRRNLLVSSLDIAPTLVDLIGVDRHEKWQGHSLAPALRDASAAPVREHLVLESAHRHEVAVRTPDWLYREIRPRFRKARKILYYLGYAPNRAFELYDLGADPEERTNVYVEGHPALPALREALAAEFNDTEARTDAAPGQVLSPQHGAALRALGYAE